MKKLTLKKLVIRSFLVIFCLAVFLLGVINPISIKGTPKYYCSNTSVAQAFPSITDIIKKWFNKPEEKQEDRKEKVSVYLGGYPLGFMLSCSGVVVVVISNENVENLKEGDIINMIEGHEVSNSDDIKKVINSEKYRGKQLSMTITRADQKQTAKITPIFDKVQKEYKLGIWVRDNAAGVGTLTYIRQDNLRFGALGHSVCDIDTGSLLPVKSGEIFRCNIVGVKRGEKGNPGELKGLFLRNGSKIGNLDSNNKFGVYGDFEKPSLEEFEENIVEVANRSEVKGGKAQIRCTIDGVTPKYYDIEIVKTYFQSTKDNKSMFIRVTDKELLEKTGGIVQGMSGSPIIQNGKLVGAVTHVFVSDPTKGYGVYADWMIDN